MDYETEEQYQAREIARKRDEKWKKMLENENNHPFISGNIPRKKRMKNGRKEKKGLS